MTERDTIPPKPRRILFLIYDGFEILDLAGPSAVFSACNPEAGPNNYEIKVISAEGGSVKSNAGPETISEPMNGVTPGDGDTLFIVGGDQPALDRIMENEALKLWLTDAVPAVSRFGSFCMGSMVLADVGLLDEKSAVTHWAAVRRLAKDYPQVLLKPESLYVKDRKIWTSAGATTGIDMALAMVAEDLGVKVMGEVAQRLIIYAHRPGNDSQNSSVLDAQITAGDTFSGVIAWLSTQLDQPIKVADMADVAGMSERNFYRKFTAKLGITPSKYLEQLRLERGKQFLEAGMPLKTVAPSVGFRSEAGFRSAFQTRFGVSPSFLQQSIKKRED